MTAHRLLIWLIPGAVVTAVAYYGGYAYAVRHNDILVEFTAAKHHSAEALEAFTQVLKTTDFCDGAKP